MLDKFITLLRKWINIAIYIWGGQGQRITSEAQIRNMETSTANADRAIALWNKRGRDAVAFDCSGLVIWALQTLGLISYDTTADGIFDKCAKISKGDLHLGDFTFRVNTAGNANHIGIVTRFVNGEPWVTEARGRDYGVVERAINNIPGYWERFGRNPFIDTTGGTDIMLQKGDKGQPVYDLQTAFQRLGYNIGAFKNMLDAAILDGRDGSFGATMDGCVKLLQGRHNLPLTGIVDAATYGKLAIDLAALPASTGITQTQLDDANAQIDNYKNQIGVMSGELAGLNGVNLAQLQELKAVGIALDTLNAISSKY